jgi:tetratricopeptide (TPR) repeat protein
LDSAVAIAGADLDTIESLVDKNLVRHTGERFWMLETIRTYAIEQLEQAGEAEEIRRLHAEHFVALAEKAQPHLVTDASKEWLDRLEPEHDNLRAAYDWFEAVGDTQRLLRLAGALTELWQFRGHLAEGRRRLAAALRADPRPTTARAAALQGAVDIAASIGDLATAKSHSEEALSLNRSLGNALGVALALSGLGYVSLEDGDLVGGQRILEESVRTLRQLGEEHQMLHVGRTLAWTYHRLGELDRARELHEENLQRARALGNRLATANTLGSLAAIATDEGRLHDAMSLMRENWPIVQDLGDFLGIAEDLSRMAKALAVAGRAETAARVLSCFEMLREETGGAEVWVQREIEETSAIVREQLDDASFAEEWAKGRKLSAEEAMALGFDSGV